ncbi:MAG TPA: beta-ketoacyl-[acyl-carrier-protein] synthase family protein [Burkholderiales bacterium]|nr:beta-ketoacyl-[acyl-carrier-protein] synthase family protein [Burkholderiales bacterium]
MQPLVISRLSAVNSLGAGSQATLEALRRGKSGLNPCAFETVALDTYVGEVANLDDVSIRPDLRDFECRNNRLAQWCMETDGFSEAVAAARVKYGPARIGVFMGTSTSGLLETEVAYRHRDPNTGALPPDFRYAERQNTFSLGSFVQRYLGLQGPAFVVSSACSSTAKVFGNAARMIAAGVCDAAVVGGVDTLCLTTLYGFNSLGLVSRFPCRPFDVNRDGISLGEGAGFVLLEKASEQGSQSAAMLLGIGESSDAYHMSTPHPEGLGARLAMQRALDAAGLQPSEIDYINLHGTATKTNDAGEGRAVSDLFGAQIPCSSTKGWTGHLLGAAGITEAIISILAIHHDFIPGSLNTRDLDSSVDIDYRLENSHARLNRVLSNSFGFGGSNCSLIIGRVGG